MSAFKRFVEIGRVVLINYGEHSGSLAVIVNVIDQNRVLIAGVSADSPVARQTISVKRISLTDFSIQIPVGARLRTVVKAYNKAGVQTKWEATSWAKKLAAAEAKRGLSDFDRFKSRKIAAKAK